MSTVNLNQNKTSEQTAASDTAPKDRIEELKRALDYEKKRYERLKSRSIINTWGTILIWIGLIGLMTLTVLIALRWFALDDILLYAMVAAGVLVAGIVMRASLMIGGLVAPDIPEEDALDEIIGLEDKEDAIVRLNLVIERTRIGIEFSSLSSQAKSYATSLLDRAQTFLNDVQDVKQLENVGEFVKVALQTKSTIVTESRLIVAYTMIGIGTLASIAFLTRNSTWEAPMLWVPLPIVVWSAVGGFSSVLYRYVYQENEFREPTPKWLLIRPILGLVLGIVTYFAFIAGLLAVTDSGGAIAEIDRGRQIALMVFSFMAGFSDRFANLVLGSIIGRVATQNEAPFGRNKVLKGITPLSRSDSSVPESEGVATDRADRRQ